jgi:hypothetical protein
MRLSTAMMMITNERFPVHRAVEGAVLDMAMTMITARVRGTRMPVRKGPGKGREQRIGRGQVRRMRMGREKGRRLRTGRGKGRCSEWETVMGKVLVNTPQEEMISLVPLLGRCRWKCQRQSWTQRAN